ncbi:hypothetical protein QF035_004196 [Streptomyces umbrinus]|uniref:Uncharacterized protein n=1 Tax=Streptomyces umbrinus TaxID=67370 RepID=A0ABU0SSS1_9ACTN|nr:hypothetical protein [Streptomyces umbrinus]MDQ1026614.1 hypothetical protein [Streptomyces umbrinus]
MSLVELIAQADERGLAASGLACLDRCVPLLGGDDEILRPLWASLAESEGWGEDWGERVEQARAKLDVPGVAAGGPGDGGFAEGEATVLAHRMLGAVPVDRGAGNLREWADACSVAALQIHRLLDAAGDGASSVTARREGRTQDMSPLVAAELRRQIAILELLSAHGPAGIRKALDLSTEGRRVLRAVVSRRARGRV